MKSKKPIRSLTAVTGLLIVLALVIWLIAMCCLTSITAEQAALRYIDVNRYRASTLADRSFYGGFQGENYQENYRESRFWEAVSTGELSTGGSIIIEGNDGFLDRRDSDVTFSATSIYDAEGNAIERSWDDFFYFMYLTEEQWEAKNEGPENNARAFFDRGKLTTAGAALISKADTISKVRAVRISGVLDGVEFTPSIIEYVDRDEFEQALRKKGSGDYTVAGVVQDYNLPWITAYVNTSTLEEDTEIVTLYADAAWWNVCHSEESPSFSYRGQDYDNLYELVDAVGPEFASGLKNMHRYEGLDLLLISVDYCQTFDGTMYFDPYYYGKNAYTDEAPEIEFYTVSAVWCSPWRTAFSELRNVYIITFLVATALVLLIRSNIKRNLLEPIKMVNNGIDNSWCDLFSTDSAPGIWHEAADLIRNYDETRDRLRMRDNEISRLNAALNYAKNAEENRRLMTSNIAHELKTPLAVIHSYAEGLKEHIAEEKREKYLDVILSESERTDAMVLEMLDLSRLEAGKVKLSLDNFSLTDLTQAVFEKLELAAQAKELKVSFEFPDECILTADESRMAQVVENFASNAVKYTPVGGNISVRISTSRGKTYFAIANDCQPLTSEALSKVWDTFYRMDEARSGGGTGLGLAISKSIINLHGGSCSVCNTKTGVEFTFTI